MAPRSYLYVPADRPDRLARAFDRGADALIVDLEDSVAPGHKDQARAHLVEWLPTAASPVWVRVNSGPVGTLDIEAMATCPNVAGLCLAKANSAPAVAAVAQALDATGSPARLAPLLEDAAGVLDARSIAAAPRVCRLHMGEADLRAQLAITPGPDERELLAIRTQAVLVSAAAGIDAPVGPVSTDFTDLAALDESTRALRRLGFYGRACIHPAQLAVVNRVFTVTNSEVDTARSVLARYAGSGGSATTAADGSMLDEAVARTARRVIELAEEYGTLDQ